MTRDTDKKVQSTDSIKKTSKNGKNRKIKIDPNSHLYHKRTGSRQFCTCASCNFYYRKIIRDKIKKVLYENKDIKLQKDTL